MTSAKSINFVNIGTLSGMERVFVGVTLEVRKKSREMSQENKNPCGVTGIGWRRPGMGIKILVRKNPRHLVQRSRALKRKGNRCFLGLGRLVSILHILFLSF